MPSIPNAIIVRRLNCNRCKWFTFKKHYSLICSTEARK
jgi:hypothetical protein